MAESIEQVLTIESGPADEGAREGPAVVSLRQASVAEVAGWDDLVAQFPQRRVVHTSAWLASLEASGLGRPLRLVYEQQGDIVGCLQGLLTRVGPLTVFGSPLPGWQTPGMGPVFDPDRIATSDLIEPLVRLLRTLGVDHAEMITACLDADTMRELGFRGRPVPTFRGPLTPGDEARTLKAFKTSARRNVKRASKLELKVRFEDDDQFAEEHFSQIREVFARTGHAVPFRRERALEHVRHMREAGHLIGVSVYLPDGTTNIATATFTAYAGEMLLWMWTHRTGFRWYRPTEVMTWAAMQRAMAAGCDVVDFMGRGDFKARFGATIDHSSTRWIWSRHRWLTSARDLAERVYRWQQAVRGRWQRALHDRAHGAADGATTNGDATS